MKLAITAVALLVLIENSVAAKRDGHNRKLQKKKSKAAALAAPTPSKVYGVNEDYQDHYLVRKR